MFITCLIYCLVTMHPLTRKPSPATLLSARPTNLQTSSSLQETQQAAANGDTAAQLKLAHAYENGDGVPKDAVQAAAWYRKAAEQGNAEAQNSLGVMYLLGEGVDENKQLAVQWYEKASRQGNADAMFNLGAAYYNGDGVQIDDDLSYAWFLLAKEAGNSQAASAVARAETQLSRWQITDGYKRVAQLCEDGGYAPKNEAAAASWWLKAATRGDSEAKIALAKMLLDGRGVAQDFSRARDLCKQVAKLDEPDGQYCLGYIYQRGLGVPANAKTAKGWYEPAAARGNVASIRALAQMDEAGEGAKVDLVGAAALYARLAVANDNGALRDIVRLKSQMTAEQWKKVEKRLPNLRVDPKKLNALVQSATP